MNFNQLEYFVAVAETGHMSQAAQELNVSQPALSSNIQKLEREIGVKLFDRAGRRIVLNQYGKAFLPTAKLLLFDLNDGLEELRDLKRSEDNRIIMCTRSLSYLPALEHEVYTRYPKLSLSNTDCDFDALIENVMSGAIDFCIVGKSLSTIDLSYSVFHDIEMVMLVPRDSAYASLEIAGLEAFADAEFATLQPDKASGASELDELCKLAGFKPNVTFIAADYADVIGAVRYKGNVSWTPKRLLKRFDLSGVDAVRLEGSGQFSHLTMYWNEAVLRNRPLSSEVRRTIEAYFQNPNRD